MARWPQSLFRRAPAQTVELRPDEQVALAHLCRFGETGADELRRVIETQRGSTPEMALEALTELLGKGLMSETIRIAGGLEARERRYAPTKLGLKLRTRLPESPRSTIEFIL